LKINYLLILGILISLVGILIFISESLDQFFTSILWPLLSGSSRGKTVLLFLIMGSMLIINSILIHPIISSKISFFDNWDSKQYIKLTLILAFSTYLIAILIEIWLRIKFGVSIFTIFVAQDPSASTSIMHTHVFKSSLGFVTNSVGGPISNINTGFSLIKYVYPYAIIGFITIPLTYIAGLLSLDDRSDLEKIILVIALSLSIIGMIDGGIFSQPALIGVFGLLTMYYIKSPFSLRNLVIPVVIVSLIIVVGFTLELAGTDTSSHTLTVIKQTENVDMDIYNVTSIEKLHDKTIYIIKPTTSDKKTLLNLFNSFNGTASGFFMTWNFFTYIS
jgi:hypothetical protein